MMQKISNKKVKKIYKKLLTFVSKFLYQKVRFEVYEEIQTHYKMRKKVKEVMNNAKIHTNYWISSGDENDKRKI